MTTATQTLRPDLKRRIHTPWGLSDDPPRKVAAGIYWVSTPSHGGYLLTDEALETFRKLFPGTETFAGLPWFEEDEDWSLVAIMFPEAFSEDMIAYAVKTLLSEHCRYRQVQFFLVTDPRGGILRERSRNWFEARKGEWEQRSLSSLGNDLPRDYWCVTFRQYPDGDRREVAMPYPEKHWYTTAELDRLDADFRDRNAD